MITEASLKNVYLRLAMCGESNSGKTFSSLTLLSGLVKDPSKIVIIDTESRANLYAKQFPGYKVLAVSAPFEPAKCIEALQECAKSGCEAVVIDSVSDFWGETLAMNARAAVAVRGNTFFAWGKMGHVWSDMLTAINAAPFHVVSAMRMKDHLVQETIDGKQQIVNKGKKVVGRGGNKGVKYEYQIIFALDENHKASLVKDNSNELADWTPKLIDASVGEKLKSWLGA